MIRILPIAFVLLGCGAAVPDSSVMATVEGTPISTAHFEREYVEYIAGAGLPDTPVRREAFLSRLIGVRAVIEEARDLGIEETDVFALERRRAHEKAMLEAYLHDQVYDSISVGPDDEEAMFVRVNTQLAARHLYARTREEADRLRERLAGGEAFESLAAEVFADPELARNGGYVGQFGFDEMDPAFEDAAYSLQVGEISEPVRTAQGYSIIKLEDRFTKPMLTEDEFARRRPALREYARDRKRADARRAVLREVASSADVRIDPDAADALLAGLLGPGLSEDEAFLAETFVTFRSDDGEVSWTGRQFRDAAETTSETQRRRVDSPEDLQAFVEGLAARSILLDRAGAYADDERVTGATAAALDDWVYERAYDRLVRRVQVPEDTLRAHFERYADEYQQPERREVREIVTTTRRTADSLRMALWAAPFEQLARAHSVRAASASVGGALGSLSRDELGDWADDVFSAAAGEVIGPFQVRGRYLLLQAGNSTPARPSTFEEARPLIEEELRRLRTRTALRNHVDSLKSRYSVRVFVDSFAALPLGRNAHASS